MALTDAGRSVLRYWGVVNSAVTARADTATLWQAITAEANRLGEPIPAQAFLGVNELRSLAVGIRQATATFNGSDSATALTAQMLGESPSARALEDQGLFPRLQISFQAEVTDLAGLATTQDYTTMMDIQPGMTVGEVRDALASDAEGMAGRYGVSFGDLAITGIVRV